MNHVSFHLGINGPAVYLEAETAAGLAADLAIFGITVSSTASSATVTPEKQAAAIESAKTGTAGKATGTKPPKETKPADKSPEMPIEALKEAVKDEPKARVYETSGLPEKVTKAVAKDRDAVVALLTKYEARSPAPESKLSAKFLSPAKFDDFEVELDKLLTPTEDLG